MTLLATKAIVTGASGSIGRSMALALAQAGADVVISYRSDQQGADETVDSIKSTGKNAWALQADFSSMQGVDSFAQKALAHLGKVDVLINNAAMLCRETFLELSPATMQQAFQVNTLSPLHLSQICVQNMMSNAIKGCVLNISSIAASATFPHSIGYAATKAAINKWTKNAALDLAQYGIRVNAIAPGVIESGMNEGTAQENPELWQNLLKGIPLGRTGRPKDIANMVLFLISKEAEWITGKVFEVDGGHIL